MEQIQADANRAAYNEFLAILNRTFLEALRMAEGDDPQEAAMKERPGE